MDEEVLTVEECAQTLRVSKMTVYRMIHTGDLPAFCVGKRNFRVTKEALRSYVQGSKITHVVP